MTVETGMAERNVEMESVGKGPRDLDSATAGWCQDLTIVDKQKRTEFQAELPYHNQAAPARSMTPDTLVNDDGDGSIGMIATAQTVGCVVADPTAPVYVERRLNQAYFATFRHSKCLCSGLLGLPFRISPAN